MTLTFKPKSSHMREAIYDPETHSLIITFHNNARYLHPNFPRAAWDNFIRYRSAGEFYHGLIKRVYPGKKLK